MLISRHEKHSCARSGISYSRSSSRPCKPLPDTPQHALRNVGMSRLNVGDKLRCNLGFRALHLVCGVAFLTTSVTTAWFKQPPQATVCALRATGHPPDQYDTFGVKHLIDNPVVSHSQSVDIQFQLFDTRRTWIVSQCLHRLGNALPVKRRNAAQFPFDPVADRLNPILHLPTASWFSTSAKASSKG